jgi:hypothetical protein
MQANNDMSSKVQGQLSVLKKIDGALHRFMAKKIDYSAYNDDDLKRVKVLRKKAGEMRDGVQEVVQSLSSPKYSVTSSNSRFASSDASQRVVGSFLGKES